MAHMTVEEMVNENLKDYERNFEPWYTPYLRVFAGLAIVVVLFGLLLLEVFVDHAVYDVIESLNN